MAKMTAEERKALPDTDFALPGRKYPIHNAAHARDALARVAANGTPEEQKAVKAAVKKRYPDIGKKDAAAKKHLDAGNITLATYRGMTR